MKLPQKPTPAIPDKEKEKAESKFGSMLAQFVGTGDRLSGFSSESFSITPATRLTQEKKPSSPTPKKKKDRDLFDNNLQGGLDLNELDDLVEGKDEDDEYDEAFDDLIETAFIEDEDVTFRNSLIAMGRRHAIKSLEEDPDTSEISRAFVRQEQAVEDLITEINKDTVAINRDIEMMRSLRTKNYKSMADLISARVSFANVKLSAIKELNSIQKTKFELKAKMKKGDDELGEGGVGATQTIQKLFSIGRQNLVGAVDDDVLGSNPSGGNDPDYNANAALTEIHDEAPLPPPSTDGEKFIAYEDEGVEYVLDIDSSTDDRQIYAVNKHGDVISDYPLPSNPDQLNFQINELAGEATDQLQRRYRLRRDGEDVNPESFKAGSEM